MENCKICGEQVYSPSMGGADICPSCDCGRCRYCGVKIIAFNSDIDGGKSLNMIKEHMKWHHEHTPEIVKQKNEAAQQAAKHFKKQVEEKHD